MRPQYRSRATYYWIVAKDAETGRPYLLTGGDTEQEARQRGMEMLGGQDFEIRALNTRDRDMASSIIRGKRLEQSHSLREASRRIGHEKTVQRRMRRYL